MNNAGYGQLGVFEEIAYDAIAKQFETNVYGVMHVTRAALPVMRQQRAGHIFNISSVGGALGFDFASIYCATKFALEGFSECLALEIKPFGIGVTLVEPGFFRTDFLDPSSIRYSDTPLSAYSGYAKTTQNAYDKQNHVQAGDPAKLGAALVRLSRENTPPLRFAAGSDAIKFLTGAYQVREADLSRRAALSGSLDIEGLEQTALSEPR